MKKKIQLLLLLFLISFNINAQQFLNIGLNIGDTAPPLKIKNWIKGPQIKGFQKNRIYVVEFWATWCGPCMISMPRLSVLANKYKDSVTVIAIDIFEKRNTPVTQIEKVVETMGNRMDFPVGVDDGNFMAKIGLIPQKRVEYLQRLSSMTEKSIGLGIHNFWTAY